KDEFNSKAPGMMSLITLGITVSYAYSVYAVAARYVTGEHVMDFFFEFTTLILIMLLGQWIEMKALGEAGDAQKALAELVLKDEFNSKAPGMMSLITLGITVSYAYSVYAVAARYVTGEHVMDFFFEFTTLILIMLLGHWIEMKALGEAGDAQKALAELVPKD